MGLLIGNPAFIDYFMNGKFFILEWITDIQNTGSEYMHICDRNVDSEGLIMCHWN